MIQRDDLIEQVDQRFKDLATLASESWSNIAITDQVKALHVEVKKLYAPVVVPGPPIPPPKPEGRLYVDSSTRWG